MGFDRKTKWHFLALGVTVGVVFLSALFLYPIKGLYVSPDETANAFFAKRFSAHATLTIPEPLNHVLGDAIHPRSTISLGGMLVPQGFIGLPVVYGTLARFFGDGLIPVFTLMFAAVAVFAWYGVVRKLFSQNIALFSAVFLAMHPAWWYYSSRGLLPNVLLVSFLILGAWFLARSVRASFAYTALSGLFFGAALFVRPSEVFWVVGGLLIAWGFTHKTFDWKRIALFAVCVIVAWTPMFFLNQATYGSGFTTGYTAQSPLEPVVVATDAAAGFAADASLLPFGFDARSIAKNVATYGMGLFWWMSVLVIAGFILSILRLRVATSEQRKMVIGYATVFLFVSVWLAASYGSWMFSDSPDPNAISIGNSHVRYWLPIFVLYTPFAAAAVVWVLSHVRSAWSKGFLGTLITLFTFGLSAWIIFWTPGDGVLDMRATLMQSQKIREKVFLVTELESVIVVDRADKLFFPYRRVLYPLRSEYTYQLLPHVIEQVPVYYYGVTFPQKDVDYLNSDKLAALGLQIEGMETFAAESLYRIKKK